MDLEPRVELGLCFPQKWKTCGGGRNDGAVPLDPSLRYMYVTDCFVSILVHRLRSQCYHQESTRN